MFSGSPPQVTLPTVQTFAVNSSNDLYLDQDGNMVLAFDIQAVLQLCRQAALTLLGEMLLATDQGIPYQTAVWVGVPNLIIFQGALREAWLATPGVTGVTNLVTQQGTITNATNTPIPVNGVTYTATIETIFGTGDIASEDIFNG